MTDPAFEAVKAFIDRAETIATRLENSQESEPVSRWQIAHLLMLELLDHMPAILTMTDAPEVVDAFDTIAAEADTNAQIQAYFEADGAEVDTWQEADALHIVFDFVPEKIRLLVLQTIGRLTTNEPEIMQLDPETIHAIFTH